MTLKLPTDFFDQAQTPAVVDKDRELASKLVDWAASTRSGAPKVERKTKTISDSVWVNLLRDVDRWTKNGEWGGAGARHLVALYALLHARVYEVEPAELTPTTRLHAVGMAARMLDREFSGDIPAVVDFMRWCWLREEGREDWRRKNTREGGHIGWKLMFGGALLTEYRLANRRQVAR